MFLEHQIENHSGRIEVVCGSMFSGKTEELIRRIKRAKIAKQKCVIFKPKIDVRYDDTKVVSHDKNAIASIVVEKANEILKHSNNIDVIGVDEAQFFDLNLVDICDYLADKGIRVIVAGLDLDAFGQPFGPMPNLIAKADYVTKVHAICVDCGQPARHSFRIASEEQLVLLGDVKEYEALCRVCFADKFNKKFDLE